MKDESNKRRSDEEGPLSNWKEEELLNGEIVRSTTVILRGKGCSFARREPCTMCGYNNIVSTLDEGMSILAQLKSISGFLEGSPYIKLFTSGSLLDPGEIKRSERLEIIEYLHTLSDSSRILFETRPEFINNTSLDDILSRHENIEIAIGLETADEGVRKQLIGKSFSNQEFFDAADMVKDRGINLKIYLLMKPPILTEIESIYDIMTSMAILSKRYDGSTLSINPMNIQKSTAVERLYITGHYRPPWLWSLIHVLKQGNDTYGEKIRIVSHPTGGGRSRGVHNCGRCDPLLMKAINAFNLSRDSGLLNFDQVCCKASWLEEISR